MAAFLLFGLVLLFGGFVMAQKAFDREFRDRNRKTYRLVFPNDMSSDQVAAWLRSLGGKFKHADHLFGARPTVAFEVWSTSEGIIHLLRVPWQAADEVIGNMTAHIPGLRYEEEKEFPRRIWTRAMEVQLIHGRHQLSIVKPGELSTNILKSVHPVNKNEAVVWQVVMTPASRERMPVYEKPDKPSIWDTLLNTHNPNRDDVSDERDKVRERNFDAVVRIGVVAETRPHAIKLLRKVFTNLQSADSPSAWFRQRPFIRAEQMQQRIDKASSSLYRFPARFSTRELSEVIAWPIDNPNVPGLPRALARILPAAATVPQEGRIIGRSNEPGNERLIATPYAYATYHTHVLGPIGSGKTTLLANMFRQDVERGYGAVLIETKGDLFFQALDYIPPERLGDVVILDVSDTKHPVGFNVLRQGNPSVAIDELKNLFTNLFKDNPSLWMNKVLHHGLHTLLHDPGATFMDLMPLLSPSSDELVWRDELVRTACGEDIQMRNFWQDFENESRRRQDEIVAPLANRIWALNSSKLRNILGQSESSFDLAEIVRNGKILLVNLSGIEREAATMMGTLLMNSLWNAIKAEQPSNPVFLTLDEFQRFLRLPLDAQEMLEQARSMGLGMTLAHQHFGQLDRDMADALNANARTKVIFQTASDDASRAARVLGNMVSETDLMNLGRYEAFAKVATDAGISPPLTMTTLKPSRGYGLASRLVAASRETYGRPVGEIEAAMERRHAAENQPQRRRRRQIDTDSAWG